MLRTIAHYRRYTIAASDGEMGSVHDVFFDDASWTVRYLVVDTGSWLPGRRVLLSPASVTEADPAGERFHVRLTRAQVEGSPPVEADRPVSRQHEIQLADYYGYPYYWAGPYLWGPTPYPAGPLGGPRHPVEREIQERQREVADPHLQSAREVTGYAIEATDGEIGHVEDFLLDDQAWAIRYLMIDTRNWWPGKKVVISPEWIAGVNWTDSQVRVDLNRDEIRNAPEYDASVPLARDYETRLYDHYRRTKYWDGEAGRAA